MECVGCLPSADGLIEEVHRQTPPPDVVLLDATMPGRSAFDALAELVVLSPNTRAIICSGYDDPAFINRAVNAGAWGCISKHDEPTTILRAVRAVAAGNRWPPGPTHGR
jgi:DNA-binding NarL/FixJ family response regulator